MRTIGVTTGDLMNTGEHITIRKPSILLLCVGSAGAPRPKRHLKCLRENSGAKTWLNQIKAQKQKSIYGKYQSACILIHINTLYTIRIYLVRKRTSK